MLSGIKKVNEMSFPKEKELKTIRKKLVLTEPSNSLPKSASVTQKLKYGLCEKFVIHLLEHRMSQIELARKIDIDPARLNEIVKYRIDLFTVDKLISLVQKIDPSLKINIA